MGELSNFTYNRAICLETLRKTKSLSGYPVYRLGFEPGTFTTRSMTPSH
jgi:hypothetical protein